MPQLFDGVDHIIHAGDIGLPWVILQLEEIAPVTAVRGNTDDGLEYRETEVIELGGRTILVHHIVALPQPGEPARGRIEAARPDLVVFGHTHRPHWEERHRRSYLNPGYAGKQRFRLERSVAILECAPEQMRVRFETL